MPQGDWIMKKINRRIALAAAFVLPLILVVGHSLYWYLLSRSLEDGFEAWAAGRRAQGWNLAYGTPQRSGWPFAARLDVPDLWLSSGRTLVPGGITWSAPRTTLQLGLLRPDLLVVEPRGAQRIKLGGTEIPFTADRIAVTLRIEPGVPPTDGTFETKMLRMGTAAGAVIVDRATADWQVRAAAEGEPAVTVEASADTLTLPPGPGAALGDRLRQVALNAVLTGPTVYAPDPRQRAAEWRDGGGTLEIRQLGFEWGPAGLQSSATIALDDSLQPMGAATARITGAGEALGVLASAGVIPPRAATLAQAALPLMTRQGENGEASVEVPLTLQDRRLTLGRIPIARMPTWSWQVP